jgi:hypothetical protein
VNRYSSKLLNLALALSLTAMVAGCAQGGEGAAQEGAAAESADGVTGIWDLTFDSSMGAINWKLHLQEEGTSLTGFVQLESGEIQIENGSVEDGAVSFQIESGMGGHGFALTFNGTAAGNEMTGTISGGANDGAEWTATRAN